MSRISELAYDDSLSPEERLRRLDELVRIGVSETELIEIESYTEMLCLIIDARKDRSE